jgi:integrase/recombinase XerC
MDIAVAISQFITACSSRNLTDKTICAYRYNLDRLQCYADQHNILAVESVTPNDLCEILASLRAEHPRYHFSKIASSKTMSAHTIHQTYRTLRTFFIWLVRQDVVTRNPILKIDQPKLPKHLVKRLDIDQSKQLINAIKHTAQPARNLAIVALMLDSGLRVGEVVNLEISRVDLKLGKAIVLGKGDKEREVPLGQMTCRALETWLWVRGENKSPRVFISRLGKPLKANPILLMLRRIKIKLGWSSLHPHLLRHTFAKLYLEEGDIKTLQVILGHASIETTAEIYLDPDFKDLKRKHNRASPFVLMKSE